ncbi:MAG: glycosyltransferase [Nitrospiraceae bacterium]|nr:glycosyltransferase [Nitrospiraceae bacterium]
MNGPTPSDAPIRVVFCHYAADFGGGSDRSLFDIVTHLPRDRFSPAIILKTGDPLAEAYRAASVDVVELPLRSPRGAVGRFLVVYWPSVFQVAGTIRRLRADAVHVNTLYNIVGAMAARAARCPLVWHVREILPGSRAVGLMLRMQRFLATRAVAISNAVAGTMHVTNAQLRVVLNGIDLSDYETPRGPATVRAELGIDPDVPIVTTVGRLEPWKGQHVFVEALPAVLDAHPEAHVLVVGACALKKPGYERRLRERCRELGIGQRVTFTGPRKDVPALLAASDVLVLPSATPEPFGRTVVEAMAAGCPVVATAAGGPLDIVVDGQTGWLTPPNDPAAMADRIGRLLDDPQEARAMGQRGRERAQAQFSLTRLVDDMANIFEEVVGRR